MPYTPPDKKAPSAFAPLAVEPRYNARPGIPNVTMLDASAPPPVFKYPKFELQFDSEDEPITDKTISLVEELLSLDHEPMPATKQLVALHQALGQAVIQMTRNKHKMYSILGRSQDVCNYILANLADSERSESRPETVLETMERSYKLISALEEILLEIAILVPAELETLGPTSFLSWPQIRTALIKIWNHLEGAPFDAIPSRRLVSFCQSSYFDDCAWLSRLLHEVIEPEITNQFPENQGTPSNVILVIEGLTVLESTLKCFSLTGELRNIAIDMATILAIKLSEIASLAEEEEIHTSKNGTSKLSEENRDWLLGVLAGTLSGVNQDSPLIQLDVSEILCRWLKVRSSAPFVVPPPPAEALSRTVQRLSPSAPSSFGSKKRLPTKTKLTIKSGGSKKRRDQPATTFFPDFAWMPATGIDENGPATPVERVSSRDNPLNEFSNALCQQRPAVDGQKREGGGEDGDSIFPEFTMPSSPSNPGQTSPPVVKSPKFELHTGSSDDTDDDDDDDDDDNDDDDDDDDDAAAAIQNPLVSKIMSHGTSSPTVRGHSEPLSRPISLRGNEPSTRDRFPLKPALKSNHSSPHLPSLAHQRALTQSAPSTPNLEKTAWASSSANGGSARGLPGSTYSVPPAPKVVHFASERSVLESVIVFSRGARPRSLSNPGGYDTETETESEGYDSTAGFGGSRYPFPVMPKNEVVLQLDEAVSSEVPMKRALGSNGYGVDDERHFVYLETIMLPSSRPPTIRGSVLVRNVAFQKRVAVRFTLDDWQTISEVSCNYSASLPNMPPPFSSSGSSFTPGSGRSATIAGPLPSSGSSSSTSLSNGKSESWDRFTFTIKLEDVERTLPNKRVSLVVKYQVPSQWGFEHGGEWWDNNSNKNYEFGFKMGKKAMANSAVEEGGPSALAARTSASVNHGHDTSPVTRTQSLPPLPSPDPVRATPSPLLISPNNSVLGLDGLGKVKPLLPPIISEEPKLRAGRGPTFTDVPNPRGSPPGSPVGRNSPTGSTSSIPPLPGSVSGITHGIPSPNLAGLERPAPLPSPEPVAAEPAPALAPAPTPAPPQPKKRRDQPANTFVPDFWWMPATVIDENGPATPVERVSSRDNPLNEFSNALGQQRPAVDGQKREEGGEDGSSSFPEFTTLSSLSNPGQSNHSSTHLPFLVHQRALTQSAPSTPSSQMSAWAWSSASEGFAPESPPSTYSIPPTPRSVYFASQKSVQESIVAFSKGARPRPILYPGGHDTQTEPESEGYDSTASAGGSPYPFPVMPKNRIVPQLDEAVSSYVPMKRALGSNGYGVDDERHFVYLETIMLPSSRPPTIRGSVLVRNVAFQKRVAVRFTLDDWQTISKVNCNYSASFPNIPPPFSSPGSSFTPGHVRSATIAGPLPSSGSSSSTSLSNGKSESWDRFTFTIKLEDVERTLPNKRMFLVVKYQVPSQWGFEDGGKWWDNNSNKNYEFGFKMGKKAMANSAVEEGGPSALAARTSASVNRGHDTSPVTRTQSLPPLPSPDPVRATPSPLLISPNNSVLGLDGLGKVKPLLPPIVFEGPKLRAERGLTFTDVPSPRGSPPGSPVGRNSPTGSTSSIPPLPGSVSGITHGITSPNLAGLGRPAPPPAPEPVAAEPAPTPAPTQPFAQPSNPQALTFPTANLSPTGTVGEKRGLSLSNYVSPTMAMSPSSMSINNTNSMQDMNSLMGSGGDGGEKAYAHGKQPSLPYVYTPPSTIDRKDNQNGPLTPGSLRLVGRMPTTIIDENRSTAPVERVPSWDIPLHGSGMLGRRTSLQAGQTMRLDLPQRPKFNIPPAEELSPTPLGRRPSPSAPSSSGSENGSPTKTGLTMKSGKSKRRRDLPDTTPVPQFGLGLNMGASPASGNGPPPEFLAKYCFFVSSPGVSPPTSNSPATSSAVTSPPPSFRTGVDTPRASSSGLVNPSTWQSDSTCPVPEQAWNPCI